MFIYFFIFFVAIIPELGLNFYKIRLKFAVREVSSYKLQSLKLYVNSILMIFMDSFSEDTKKLFLIGIVKNHFTYCKDSQCFCKQKTVFSVEDKKKIEVNQK